MAAVKLGALKQVVQFLRAAAGDDGFSETEVFAAYGAPVRSKKEDASDGEVWRAAQVSATITARFIVRRTIFTSGITPRDRLRCEARDYEITGIREVAESRRRYFEMSATTEIGKRP
ncbi:head-tail adaptor protein [Falsihalocynthiibacter arcticus]|uniref:head-tail adaptor protein n=1 Tax=Falsihalocynthiibacter arcticus TaxID=1579316 RepID=UPI0030020945